MFFLHLLTALCPHGLLCRATAAELWGPHEWYSPHTCNLRAFSSSLYIIYYHCLATCSSFNLAYYVVHTSRVCKNSRGNPALGSKASQE